MLSCYKKTLILSLAPSALIVDTLYFNLKRRKDANSFVGAFGAPKIANFCTARRKFFFKCRSRCTPLENFVRAPMYTTIILPKSFLGGGSVLEPVSNVIALIYLFSRPNSSVDSPVRLLATPSFRCPCSFSHNLKFLGFLYIDIREIAVLNV